MIKTYNTLKTLKLLKAKSNELIDRLFSKLGHTKLPLSKEEQDARKPLPPEILTDALQDKVHTDIGELIRSEKIEREFILPQNNFRLYFMPKIEFRSKQSSWWYRDFLTMEDLNSYLKEIGDQIELYSISENLIPWQDMRKSMTVFQVGEISVLDICPQDGDVIRKIEEFK